MACRQAGGDVVREGAVPAAPVGIAPTWASFAQLFPAPMLDVHLRHSVAQGRKRDLDLRRARPISRDVPHVAQSPRRLPYGDLTPLDLLARGRALEDPAACTALELGLPSFTCEIV